MYNYLEFVCGGNMGRSPIEAAVAKRELSRLGYYDVNVDSSGTSVDFLKTATDEQIQNAVEPYIPAMIGAGVITPQQEDDLRAGRTVRAIVMPIIDKLSESELDRVGEILWLKKLVHYGDEERLRHPKQTIVRPHAELILVNGKRNLQGVQAMYSQTNYKPLIENIGEFEDPFFMSFKQHWELAAKLEIATFGAIKRFYN